ncbi:MAG: hypothetical protein AAFR87_30210 [Bacteroidota bacterium]
MKISFLKPFTLFLMIAMIVFYACEEEEPLTFANNPAQYCADNPSDTQCFGYDSTTFCQNNPNFTGCIVTFESDSAAFCQANPGDTRCCVFDTEPKCFCGEHPEDPRCEQSFGDLLFFNGFEDITMQPSNWEDVLDNVDPDFEVFGLYNGGASDNVTAVQGNSYVSFVVSPLSTVLDGGKVGRFAIDQGKANPTIDLSGYTDPYINIWVNSGSNPQNVINVDVDFRGSTGDRDRYATFPYENDSTNTVSWIKTPTEGEWVLYSLKLDQPIWYKEGMTDSLVNFWRLPAEAERTFDRLRVDFRLETALAPDNRDSRDFVAHVDGLSISEGMLVDVRPE